MSREKFVDHVMQRITVPNPDDIAIVRYQAGKQFDKGWTELECITMLHYMQECAPDLPEKFACEALAQIERAVNRRIAG